MSFHQDFSHRSILVNPLIESSIPAKTVLRNPLFTRIVNKFRNIVSTMIRPENGSKVAIFTGQGPRGASVNLSGWTIFTPSIDTNIVYVSNSTGNDGTGIVGDINHPYKTVSAGINQLRDGKPDWILFKKGDTWTNENIGTLQINGRSASEPMLIGAYGSGSRPLFKVNSGLFITCKNVTDNGVDTGLFLAIVGIEAYCYVQDPGNVSFGGGATSVQGITLGGWTSPNHSTIIEDCKLSYFENNVRIINNLTQSGSVSFRRNIIHNSYNLSGASQGILMGEISNWLLEENVFIENGWNRALVAGGNANAKGNIFNRNVYLQSQGAGIIGNAPGTYRRNISIYSSAEGAQIRPGGTVENNFHVLNSDGFNLGHTSSAGDGSHVAIHNTTAKYNVIINSTDIGGQGASSPRGTGIDMVNCTSTVVASNNIIAHAASAVTGNESGVTFEDDSIDAQFINNIVYNCHTEKLDFGTGCISTGNAVENDNLNSSGYQAAVTNTDLTGYVYGTLAGGTKTVDDFIVAVKQQSRDTWNTTLTAAYFGDSVRTIFNQSQIGH